MQVDTTLQISCIAKIKARGYFYVYIFYQIYYTIL